MCYGTEMLSHLPDTSITVVDLDGAEQGGSEAGEHRHTGMDLINKVVLPVVHPNVMVLVYGVRTHEATTLLKLSKSGPVHCLHS